MSVCNVCGFALDKPLYISVNDSSLTSLSELRPGKTEVYFCSQCGHLQTTPLPNLADYYETEYRISLDSEDEDQLYKVDSGRQIFRVEHQVQTLLKKLQVPRGANILDYGCAKGAATRKLLQLRPDVSASLFDVSDMYLPFWNRFADASRWATHELRTDWADAFDVVMSFYVLEHVADPVQTLQRMASVLKPHGVIYWLVPNVLANPADFVVADHINHFSLSSLTETMQRAGLQVLEIDSESHTAGWIVVAARGETQLASQTKISTGSSDELNRQVQELSIYWSLIGQRIAGFEATCAELAPRAIYGSGFYGMFLASCLSALDLVECFVDQSPFQQGKSLLGKPIVSPDDLPKNIQKVFVGLNPRIAREAIAQVEPWRNRNHHYFFL